MGNQSSSLHQAAAHNDVEKLEWLVAHENANVNDRDKDGWTPLHFASYGGALEATQALLLRGANPAAADKAGRTPLHLASLQGHSTLASLLIGRGAAVDPKDENHMTPLHKAAIKGNAEVGEQLLRLGADPNGEATDGTTPLHLAAWKDHIAFVRLLLSMGARIQAVNNSGRTPLHEAAESGNTKVVQLLLSMGADPRTPDKEGETAGSLAAKAGHKDVADLVGGPGRASQGMGGSAPSAPPFQGGGGSLYPQVYKPSEESVEKQANKDFWDDNLAPADKEKASNAGFWGDAMGGSSAPTPAPRKPTPYEEASKEAARNKEFWDKQLAGGVPKIQQRSQQWGERADRAAGAWSDQINKDTQAQQQQQQQDPRKQFEQNVLKQAQGLWNMLQGKGGDNGGERRKQEEVRRAQAAQVDSEWGGAPKGRTDPSGGWGGAQAGVPRQEKYDLEPYDDDDYEPEAKPARKGREGYQDAGDLQRKLAQLELDVDREQGWIRGGSKTDADEAAMRRQRIKSQEAEIAALKKQLGGGPFGFGGHTGGRNTGHGIPSEYLCPITQEIMHDPVTAGDGYTYERGPIEKWLSAHNTSPMTGGLMPKGGLQANNSLKASIRQWQS